MFREKIGHLLNRITIFLPLLKKRNLLITGAHRTGTTLLGVLFAESDDFSFVYEPFNPDYGTNLKEFVCEDCGLRIDTWFMGVNDSNERDWYRHMKHLVNSRAIRGKRSVIKDPFAFMSTEWLQREFNTDVLVMVRNPLSFVSSLKKMEWPFDFDNFLRQYWLMDGYLSEFKDDIEEFSKNKKDIIDQGILLWNIFYTYANDMRKIHPGWVFLKLEDFSAQPEKHFKELCETFYIEYTEKMKKKVLELTSEKNPIESKKEVVHSLNRNSKKQRDIWKGRLTDQEVKRIEDGTKSVREIYGY
jgi:hypothetical protein